MDRTDDYVGTHTPLSHFEVPTGALCGATPAGFVAQFPENVRCPACRDMLEDLGHLRR